MPSVELCSVSLTGAFLQTSTPHSAGIADDGSDHCAVYPIG